MSYIHYNLFVYTKIVMEKKNNKKQQMRTEDEEIESTPLEQSVFHKTKIVINAIKYLKKVIQKLSQDEMDATNKQKLFVHYNELVDIIIDHSRKIEIDKMVVTDTKQSRNIEDIGVDIY